MSDLTIEQARNILKSVDYDDRLVAGRMLMPSGLHSEDMSSMEEVSWFLQPSQRSLPAIRLDTLARWIETHFHDRQTADRIREIALHSPSQAEACHSCWELVTARVEQAKEVLNG